MLSCTDLQTYLKENGWNCKISFISQMLNNFTPSHEQSIVNMLLNTDIKEFGDVCLNSELFKSTRLESPLVLQIKSVRNVCCPLNYKESVQNALFVLSLTDGSSTAFALVTDKSKVKRKWLDVAHGEKIQIKPGCLIFEKYFILVDNMFLLLGGEVRNLKLKWKLKQKSTEFKRSGKFGVTNPPLWVEFGSDFEKSVVESRNVHSESSQPRQERSLDVDMESIIPYCRDFNQRFDLALNFQQKPEDHIESVNNLKSTSEPKESKMEAPVAYYIPEWASENYQTETNEECFSTIGRRGGRGRQRFRHRR
ncbi:hypothetical protein GJ496_004842 [Pomphorhynchus laevis]|nr:hypothetical protein GJ496_004842 [Pomphorhynchus laevis]